MPWLLSSNVQALYQAKSFAFFTPDIKTDCKSLFPDTPPKSTFGKDIVVIPYLESLPGSTLIIASPFLNLIQIEPYLSYNPRLGSITFIALTIVSLKFCFRSLSILSFSSLFFWSSDNSTSPTNLSRIYWGTLVSYNSDNHSIELLVR